MTHAAMPIFADEPGFLPQADDHTLLDVLDRILDHGVVVTGDAVISVAGVDLLYVGIKLLASSVETAERIGVAIPCGARAAA
jgi:hypothetical protein